MGHEAPSKRPHLSSFIDHNPQDRPTKKMRKTRETGNHLPEEAFAGWTLKCRNRQSKERKILCKVGFIKMCVWYVFWLHNITPVLDIEALAVIYLVEGNFPLQWVTKSRFPNDNTEHALWHHKHTSYCRRHTPLLLPLVPLGHRMPCVRVRVNHCNSQPPL